MKADEHDWLEHVRWRECVRCGQRQYRATSGKRGATSAPTQWLPGAGPCVPQDGAAGEPSRAAAVRFVYSVIRALG